MIKLFLTDIDGCLTDGGCYSFGSPSDHIENIAKRYFARDFHGLSMLNAAGVKVAVISSNTSETDRRKINVSAPYAEVFQGIKDKEKFVFDNFVRNGKYSWEEISYIGDDVIDAGLLHAVGFAACPSDAEDEIIEFITSLKDGYVSTKKGGYGCVRDLCNFILKTGGY